MTGMGLCIRVADIIHAANCDPPAMLKRLCRDLPWMEEFLHAQGDAVTGSTTPKKIAWQANFLLQFLRGEPELSLDQLKKKVGLWDVPDQGELQGVLHST
ncbi:hypothetical protein BV898_17972 [Hypsibius exemplaris]|uniref:Uncharacterized protein n=1 Tax=Hypsibius exemplaris TaxID=2072580 RepID=A0A9X6NHY5_HYPEX|nr:hypothetical protein BV898_17972 [Hypsibius exemplaris]